MNQSIEFMRDRIIFCFTVATLLSCLSSASLSAQSGGGSGVEEKEYTFHLLYLDLQNKKGKADEGVGFQFENDGEVYGLAAFAGALTRGYAYKGPPMLNFFEEEVDASGETVRRPVVAVKMGEAGAKIIVLVRDRRGGLRSSLIDINATKMKRNTVRIVNFSQQQLKGKVGEKMADLKPMGSYDFSIKGETRSFMARIGIAAFDGVEAHVVVNRRFAMRQNDRKLLVVYQTAFQPKSLSFTTFSIPDGKKIVNRSDNYKADLEAASKAESEGFYEAENPDE